MKSSPLPRRSAPMRRSPMKRTAPKARSNHLKRVTATITPEERAGKQGAHARSSALTGYRLCERCGRRRAREVHHRKNRSQGGTWDLANLLDLCSPCHLEVTVNPALAKEAKSGWSVYPTQDPAAVPVRLAGRGLVLLSDNGEIHRVEEDRKAA